MFLLTANTFALIRNVDLGFAPGLQLVLPVLPNDLSILFVFSRSEPISSSS